MRLITLPDAAARLGVPVKPFGWQPQEMLMLKLLDFFWTLLIETAENDRQTGAKRGRSS